MSDDNLILDAAQVRTQCHRVLNGGKPFREERVSKLLDSHEALRAALEAEKKLLAEVTEHARLNEVAAGAALATAEAERDTWHKIASDEGKRVEAERERVGALEAALRDLMDALWVGDQWIATRGRCREATAAARALLGEPGEER